MCIFFVKKVGLLLKTGSLKNCYVLGMDFNNLINPAYLHITVFKSIFRSAPHNVRNASTPNSGANSDYDADESDNEDFSSEFHHVALQLLDLMHTLHTRAAQIHFSWAEEAEQSAGNNGTSWGANPNNNFVNTSRYGILFPKLF